MAERILAAKSTVEGERKLVTILFADVKGSLELLGERDAEDARRLLDSVVTLMIDAVHRYEGTVSKVMGDGILAMFGAPLALEDHAVRASYAALTMQELVKRHHDELQRRHGVSVQIRVGLNSGEVVVRTIGQDLGMDYSAIGLTTHLAARMEQTAIPGTIQLTGETLTLAEGFIAARSLGLQPVKGVAAPMEIFELTGRGASRRRFDTSAARGFTPFVGRELEMEALSRALEQGRVGHGNAVAVVAEAGVGKSRLFWEFLRCEGTRGWLLMESTAISYGKATPYSPLIELLKRYFGIEDRDEPAEMRRRVSNRLVSLAEVGILPAFLALLDLPVEDSEWVALGPAQQRQRTLDALRRLVLRETQRQPVLLVLEDLHWIDSETQAFLDSLRGHLPSSRMLLLVNYRPEYQLGWGSKTALQELRVGPLEGANAEMFLASLLGTDSSVAPLKQLLLERTLGNPFFIEESVRMLAETGVLSGERGAYRLEHAPSAIKVPPTVQTILAARIDRLSPADKQLLQAAAVIGHHVPAAILRAIVDAADTELREMLLRLQGGDFLFEASLFPEPEYSFKHALTHQVTYGTLLADQRRPLHARVMAAIETLFPDRQTEHVERLAHHAVRGELWDKAVTYCRQAGDKAARRSVYREAVNSFTQACEALGRLPESRENKELAVDLRIALRAALFPLGELERVVSVLDEAEGVARAISDKRRLAQVHGLLSQARSWLGDHDRAIDSGVRAQQLGVELRDLALQVVSGYRVGNLYFNVGDYRRAAATLRRVLGSLRPEDEQERFGLVGLPAGLCLTFLTMSLAELGDFEEGIRHGDANTRLADAVNHPFDQVNACYGLGMLHLRRGSLDIAIPILERGVQFCQAGEIPALWPSMALALGLASLLTGRADGLALVEEADRQHAALNVMGSRSMFLGAHAEGCLLVGRVGEAAKLCAEALELSGQFNERGYHAWALRLLGDIFAHPTRGKPDEAEAAYGRAMTLAVELGMRPLAARCRLSLGRLLSQSGDSAAAEEHLSAARALFSEMAMRFWLAQTETDGQR